MIRISYFPGGERDREPRGVDLTWEQLCDALGARGVEPSPCTIETCGAGENAYLGKEGQCRHKYGGAWSPAVYPPGATRSKRNVGVVSLLVLDLDHVTGEELLETAARLAPYRYAAHSSHSDRRVRPDGVEERALRVVLPLSEPVLATDWPRFWQTAVGMLGGHADPAACDASRLYFLPTRRSDCELTFTTNEGGPIDVPAVLAMAPPPEVLPELAGGDGTFGPASPSLIARSRERLRNYGPAVEGRGGDQHTYNACCALLHDYALTEEEAWPVLAEWNETCVPPWDASELRVKMENARSYAEGPRGAGRREHEAAEAIAEMFGDGPVTVPPPEALPAEDEVPVPPEGDVLAILGSISRGHPELLVPVGKPGTWAYEVVAARRDVARALAAGVGEDASSEDQRLFQSAADLLRSDPPPASWLIQRLLTDGGVSSIIGEPKTTKSWMAIEACLAVSSGTPFLNSERFVVPRARGSAYFFAEEHHESVVSRFRAFARGKGWADSMVAATLARVFVQPRGKYLDLSKDEDVGRVVASVRCLPEPIGLLVLDPLRDVHTGKENESDDMSAVFKRLRLISVLLDCAVLVVHHAKKPGKEGATNGNEIRGSSVINGALDARIILKGLTGDGETTFTNVVESVVKRGRSAGTFQATLRVVDGPDHVAVSARWEAATRSEAETEKNGVAVEDTAISMLRHLALAEARHEPSPPLKALMTALRADLGGCGQARFYAAASYGAGKMWFSRDQRGRYQLTDGGRRFARELEAPPVPPAAPATLDDLIAAE